MMAFRLARIQRGRATGALARQSGGVVVYLVILLALAAAGAGGFWLYLQQLQQSQRAQEAQSNLTRLRAEVNAAVLASEEQRQRYETALTRMASIEASLAALPSLDTGRASAHLALSEAGHLLQAAEWQLQLYQDNRAALYALEKAHQRLEKFSNHRDLARVTLSVRRLIGVLNTRELPDTQSVLRDTQLLQNYILELPPIQQWRDRDLAEMFGIAPTRDSTTDANEQSDANVGEAKTRDRKWYEELWSSLVEIRPATLLGHMNLSSHNQTVLWENLLLLISRVQSAALHNNQSVYQNTLDEIQRLVSLAWPGEIRQKTVVLKLVRKMRQEVVSVNTPDMANIRQNLARAVENYERSFPVHPPDAEPERVPGSPR